MIEDWKPEPWTVPDGTTGISRETFAYKATVYECGDTVTWKVVRKSDPELVLISGSHHGGSARTSEDRVSETCEFVWPITKAIQKGDDLCLYRNAMALQIAGRGELWLTRAVVVALIVLSIALWSRL